jgi:peptidoglycan/LPS O-acetylase OafA/YrhL
MTSGSIQRPRLVYLDWLRVAATMTIIVFHFNVIAHDSAVARGIPILESALLPNTLFGVNTGAVAVSVFFILSGASLMYVYGGSEALQIKTFFKKRLLDIFPQYYVAYVSVVLFYLLINKSWADGIPAWKFMLTIIGMDGYSGIFGGVLYPNFYLVGEWFVGCLLLLYLVFPIIRRGVISSPMLNAAGIAVVAVVGYLASRRIWPDLDPAWYATSRVVDFSIGMYFIAYVKRPSGRLALGGAVMLGLLSFSNIIPGTISMTCAGVSCFLLFGWLASLVRNKTANEAVQSASRLSYSAFLVQHIAIVWVIENVSYPVVSIRTETLLLLVIFAIITSWSLLVRRFGNQVKHVLSSGIDGISGGISKAVGKDDRVPSHLKG